jgi:Putative adipose-regulatory protein (Seipin)
MVVPDPKIFIPIYFDYTLEQPSAIISYPLQTATFDVTLVLELADSPANFDLGNFVSLTDVDGTDCDGRDYKPQTGAHQLQINTSSCTDDNMAVMESSPQFRTRITDSVCPVARKLCAGNTKWAIADCTNTLNQQSPDILRAPRDCRSFPRVHTSKSD